MYCSRCSAQTLGVKYVLFFSDTRDVWDVFDLESLYYCYWHYSTGNFTISGNLYFQNLSEMNIRRLSLKLNIFLLIPIDKLIILTWLCNHSCNPSHFRLTYKMTVSSPIFVAMQQVKRWWSEKFPSSMGKANSFY